MKRIAEILDASGSDLPDLMREECQDLLEQIAEKTVCINDRTAKIKVLVADTDTDTARRLQTIPGVGPLTALAVEAFARPMESFRCGRDFAAWLGLVPRQFSSGGKDRLGRKSVPEGSWLVSMLARKPRMLVAIALANKMAQTIWAMLTRHENYRVPAQVAVA